MWTALLIAFLLCCVVVAVIMYKRRNGSSRNKFSQRTVPDDYTVPDGWPYKSIRELADLKETQGARQELGDLSHLWTARGQSPILGKFDIDNAQSITPLATPPISPSWRPW